MISSLELLDALATCKPESILIIGDIMLDEYHWCEVKRISPEAPVPICKVLKTTLVPGGAANVAANVVTLGNTPILVGVLGTDSTGEKLKKELGKAHIPTQSLVQTPERPTILKSRIIAHHQHVVRLDREDGGELPKTVQAEILKKVDGVLGQVKAIILSDYLKGTLSPGLIRAVITKARKQGIPVIVDPKGDDYSKYKGATILTPNFGEFETAIRKKTQNEDEICTEAVKLIKKLNLPALLITRSEKGMSLVLENGTKIDIPTQAKEVFDITGAGDTVIATFSVALAAGKSMEVAAAIANHAAGIVVGKMGTATATFDEIRHDIAHG
ncbi:MAG: D-glycero-beta-D-manno-heptose-7-phosphate kinase [Candidatus Margulisiibacteriota bacterium]